MHTNNVSWFKIPTAQSFSVYFSFSEISETFFIFTRLTCCIDHEKLETSVGTVQREFKATTCSWKRYSSFVSSIKSQQKKCKKNVKSVIAVKVFGKKENSKVILIHCGIKRDVLNEWLTMILSEGRCVRNFWTAPCVDTNGFDRTLVFKIRFGYVFSENHRLS